MDPSCLHHVLTPDEREYYEREGYLLLPGLLDGAEVARLAAVCDRIWAEECRHGHPPEQRLWRHSVIPRDPLLVDLVADPRILPKVWGLLGWNIAIYHAHLVMTPTEAPDAASDLPLGWHQDGGRMNLEMPGDPPPGLQLKVAYFLSDGTDEDAGTTWVIPGSHRRRHRQLPPPQAETGHPTGAVPVRAPAGSVLIFDRRLWHAGGPNRSRHMRKTMFYGFSFRWLRPKDPLGGHRELWDRVDPIRRQLLGAGRNEDSFYTPGEDDAPLRAWLRQHAPEQLVEEHNRTGGIYRQTFAATVAAQQEART